MQTMTKAAQQAITKQLPGTEARMIPLVQTTQLERSLSIEKVILPSMTAQLSTQPTRTTGVAPQLSLNKTPEREKVIISPRFAEPQITPVKDIVMPAQIVNQPQATKTIQLEPPAQKTMPKFYEPPNFREPTMPQTPKTTPIPLTPRFDFNFGGGASTRTFEPKIPREFKYATSLGGVLEGKTAFREPKMLTGGEIRPIITSRPAKHKRRKK